MKKFLYRLDSILNLKKIQAEKSLLEYSKALADRMRVDEDIRMTEERMKIASDQVRESQGKVLNPHFYSAIIYECQTIQIQKKKLEEDLLTLKNEENKKYLNFLSIKKEVDILEKHKENKKKTYELDAIKKEEKGMEDLVMSRYLSQLTNK